MDESINEETVGITNKRAERRALNELKKAERRAESEKKRAEKKAAQEKRKLEKKEAIEKKRADKLARRNRDKNSSIESEESEEQETDDSPSDVKLSIQIEGVPGDEGSINIEQTEVISQTVPTSMLMASPIRGRPHDSELIENKGNSNEVIPSDIQAQTVETTSMLMASPIRGRPHDSELIENKGNSNEVIPSDTKAPAVETTSMLMASPIRGRPHDSELIEIKGNSNEVIPSDTKAQTVETTSMLMASPIKGRPLGHSVDKDTIGNINSLIPSKLSLEELPTVSIPTDKTIDANRVQSSPIRKQDKNKANNHSYNIDDLNVEENTSSENTSRKVPRTPPPKQRSACPPSMSTLSEDSTFDGDATYNLLLTSPMNRTPPSRSKRTSNNSTQSMDRLTNRNKENNNRALRVSSADSVHTFEYRSPSQHPEDKARDETYDFLSDEARKYHERIEKEGPVTQHSYFNFKPKKSRKKTSYSPIRGRGSSLDGIESKNRSLDYQPASNDSSTFDTYRSPSQDPKDEARNDTYAFLADQSKQYNHRIEKGGTVTIQERYSSSVERPTISSSHKCDPKTPDNMSSVEYERYMHSHERQMMSEELLKARSEYQTRSTLTVPDKLGHFSAQTSASNTRNDPASRESLGDMERIQKMRGKERQNMSNELNSATKKYDKRDKQTKFDDLGHFSAQTSASNTRNDPASRESLGDMERIQKMRGKERQNMSNELNNATKTYEGREHSTVPDNIGHFGQQTSAANVRNNNVVKTQDNCTAVEYITSQRLNGRNGMRKELNKAHDRYSSRDKCTIPNKEPKSYEKMTAAYESRYDPENRHFKTNQEQIDSYADNERIIIQEVGQEANMAYTKSTRIKGSKSKPKRPQESPDETV